MYCAGKQTSYLGQKRSEYAMVMMMPMPLHRPRINRDDAPGTCGEYVQQLLDGCN